MPHNADEVPLPEARRERFSRRYRWMLRTVGCPYRVPVKLWPTAMEWTWISSGDQ